MNKNPIKALTFWGLLVLCVFISTSCFMFFDYSEPVEDGQKCILHGDKILDNELIGRWVAGDPKHLDTLIIESDGTYKQIIHLDLVEGNTIKYESEWQPWRVEYSEENIAYLHLIGYRFCGMNSDIPCERRDGDGHDFCKDERINMEGEGILIALKTPEKHYIYLHYPLGLENSYAYRLTTK